MKTRTVNKLFTVLMVFVMMLSATMVLQGSAKAEESHMGTVEGIVKTQGTYPAGLEVKLIDISQDKVLTTNTENGGYFRFDNVDPGYYKVKIPSQQYNDEMVIFNEQEGPFLVEEDENVDHEFINVDSASLEYTVSGKVTNSKDEGIPDTEITLTDTTHTFTKSFSLTDVENGTYEFMAYEGEFVLKFDAPNYKPHTRKLEINETNADDGEMDLGDVELHKTPTKPVISGFLWESGGSGVTTSMDVTIYNEAENILLHKDVDQGPYFEIGAVEGEYTVIIKAEGYEPKVIQENVNETDNDLGILQVGKSEKQEISTEINFNDWEDLTITRERTITPGSVFEAMDYEYLGSLKMQIDFAFGNKDLSVSQSEIESFRNNWLENREAGIQNTNNIMTVDNTYYMLDGTSEVNPEGLSGLEGSVMNTLSNPITVTSTMEFTGQITGTDHIVDLHLKNDYTYGNEKDYSYTLNLPDGYERYRSDKEIIPSSVDVEGYTTIEMDPKEDDGESHVRLDIRKSEDGEVTLVLEQAGNVYLKEEGHYVIRQDSEVKGEAQFSDPVSEPENYTWYLAGEEIDYGKDLQYTFTKPGTKELKVIVKDTGGDAPEASVTVNIDGEGPMGTIKSNETVDEYEEIEFSAVDFFDASEIRDYEWNFSDGSDHEMGMNVTHAFSEYGSYDVKVNVTDVVGNYNVITKEITVNDTTDPVPSLTISQDGEQIGVDEIVKGKEVLFNASGSYDPAGYEGNRTPADELTITWNIDGEEKSGETITHTFQNIGQYTLELDVEDQHGNNKTMNKELSVSPGAIPNLEILNLKFSKNKPTDGDKITITANVSNYGSKIAQEISIYLNGESIESTPTFYDGNDETNNTIPDGENRLIKFKWNVGSEGKKNVKVNITAAEEPDSGGYLRDNSMQKEINVQPPAWREYIVYALIPIIIIGVSVGLYYYREKF